MLQVFCYHFPLVAFQALLTLLIWVVRVPLSWAPLWFFFISLLLGLQLHPVVLIGCSIIRGFSDSQLSPWHLEQCLPRNRPLINFCWINEVFRGKYWPRRTNISIAITFLSYCVMMVAEARGPSSYQEKMGRHNDERRRNPIMSLFKCSKKMSKLTHDSLTQRK